MILLLSRQLSYFESDCLDFFLEVRNYISELLLAGDIKSKILFPKGALQGVSKC